MFHSRCKKTPEKMIEQLEDKVRELPLISLSIAALVGAGIGASAFFGYTQCRELRF